MGRKILRDGGSEITKLLAEVRQTAKHLSQSEHSAAKGLGKALGQGTLALQEAVDWVLSHGKAEPASTYLGAVPLVQLAGFVLGGWMMGRAALQSIHQVQNPSQSQSTPEPFYATKLAAAGFYASHVLLPSLGLLAAVKAGSEALEQAAAFTGGN